MRYWLTLDGVFKRIVRLSSDLSTSMRAFSYSFALALVFRGNQEIALGKFTFDSNSISAISIPISLFIILDLAHPFLALTSLHLMNAIRHLSLKKYQGQNLMPYDESKDKTELIFELHPLEIFGTSVLPNLMLVLKIATVGWTIITLMVCYRIVQT